MSASSRIAWLLASSLLSAFALTTAAPPKPYEQLRSEAEAAFARGAFADVKRTTTGGKGLAGVVAREKVYVNPILAALEGRSS